MDEHERKRNGIKAEKKTREKAKKKKVGRKNNKYKML